MISQSRFHLKIGTLVPTTKHKPARSHSFQQNFGLVASGHPQPMVLFFFLFRLFNVDIKLWTGTARFVSSRKLHHARPKQQMATTIIKTIWDTFTFPHKSGGITVDYLCNSGKMNNICITHIYIYRYIDICSKTRFTHSHTFKKTYGPMCSEHILYFQSQAPPNCAN